MTYAQHDDVILTVQDFGAALVTHTGMQIVPGNPLTKLVTRETVCKLHRELKRLRLGRREGRGGEGRGGEGREEEGERENIKYHLRKVPPDSYISDIEW